MFHSIKNDNAIHIDSFPETKVSIYFSFGWVKLSIWLTFNTATELMSGHQLLCNLLASSSVFHGMYSIMVMSQNLNLKIVQDWVTLLFFFLHQKYFLCDPQCYFSNAGRFHNFSKIARRVI
jgi:hypothetical protein